MKKFTLIELIVVIAVLSLLATIIVPNIQHVKENARVSALNANIRNIQVAVDSYSISHDGQLPTKKQPTVKVPQPLYFDELYPDVIRQLPKLEGAKYWIDVNGQIWGSTSDAIQDFDNESGVVTWKDGGDFVDHYNVYEILDTKTSSAVIKQKYKLITSTNETTFDGEEDMNYAISIVDANGFETAPVGSNEYLGYRDSTQNDAPVAIIDVSPKTGVTTDNTLTWSSSRSYDPNDDEIIDEEWEGKQAKYTAEGDYLVKLRVQDSKHNWSEWAEYLLHVDRGNAAPTAIITINPASNIDSLVPVTFTYEQSTDPDGDAIVEAKWKIDGVETTTPNQTFGSGQHKVDLQVKDSRGLWSPWVSKTFDVSRGNRAPVVKTISSNPSSLTNETNATWSYTYTDADSDTIQAVQWKVDSGAATSNSTFTISTVGTHTVSVRVQDTYNAWSDWYSQTVTVAQANRKPVPVIKMTPDASSTTVLDKTSVTWSYTATDPDNDSISAVEWTLDGVVKANPNGVLSGGSHTMKLRVQDSRGLWSDYVTKTFSIQGNRKPVPIITMTPDSANTTIKDNTSISWSYTYTDADNDTISAVEWTLDGVIKTSPNGVVSTGGSHTMKLRVQDNRGLWSDYVIKTFTVSTPTQKTYTYGGLSEYGDNPVTLNNVIIDATHPMTFNFTRQGIGTFSGGVWIGTNFGFGLKTAMYGKTTHTETTTTSFSGTATMTFKTEYTNVGAALSITYWGY